MPIAMQKFALTANLLGAWLVVALAAFYSLAWLVPPGQQASPMDLRPINPTIASFTALLWSFNVLLLALPSFKSQSALFRAAAIVAPIVALALVCFVFARF